MKHVQRDLFGDLAAMGDAHCQRKNDSMSAFVKCMYRALIFRRDCPDKIDPPFSEMGTLRLVGIDDVAKGRR